MSQIYKNGASVPIGPGIVESLTGNSGGAVDPTGNNINTIGSGSITIVGNPGTSTLTTQLTGITNHAVQIGAGTATLTQLVGTDNTALLGHTGSNPTFGQIPNSVLVNSSITVTSPDGSISVVGSPVSLGGTVKLEVNAGAPYISLSPYIVGTDVHSGYSTIAAAYAAAVGAAVPANVYIKPKLDGTPYTENLVLSNHINLVAFLPGNENTASTVKIIGKLTDNGVAANVICSGITFQTNSDYILQLTAAGSDVAFMECRLLCQNNTGLRSTALTNIYLWNCTADVGTTGISLFSMTAGDIWIEYTKVTNSGSSTTLPTLSGNFCTAISSYFDIPLGCTSTGVFNLYYCRINSNAVNAIGFTSAGTGVSTLNHCEINSGSASAISIGAGTIVNVATANLASSNTNVLTGSGTLQYGGIVFYGTSSGHNVTTETPYATLN